MRSALSNAIDEFATAPMAAGRLMRDLFSETTPDAFLQLALPLVRFSPEKAGTQYLLTLLLLNDLILAPLVDPGVFSFDQAIAIAKQLVKIEPLLDIKMVRTLLDRNNQTDLSKRIDNNTGVRLLEIMAAVSDGGRILPIMAQLLQHANPKIRSKAALLVGRTNKNCKWVEQRLEEADPRVRANAVESLWGVESQDAKKLFWGAVCDPDNRVAGNALMGLYRLGEVACIPLIVNLLSHEQTDFRVTGVWVMGETGDPRFLALLARMISDPDALVRSRVFGAIAKLKQAAAKYAAASNLRVHVLPSAAEAPAGWKEVVAAIWEQGLEGVQTVCGLRPTQLVLYEDSRLVTQYEVSEVTRSESLSIAFALPRIAQRDHPFHAQCEEAFRAALAHKRKSDFWLVLKYLAETQRDVPVAHRGGKRILQIEPPTEATTPEVWLPADARFHNDAAGILSAVESPGNRMLLPDSPIKAMQTLLPSLSQCRGSRQLVFVYHPEVSAADWERWEEIAKAALTIRVSVHVIAFGPQPALAQLSAKTGGTFTLLRSAEQFQPALEGLCASLVNSYAIRYRSLIQDERVSQAELKVRVYRPGSFGEGMLEAGACCLENAEVA